MRARARAHTHTHTHFSTYAQTLKELWLRSAQVGSILQSLSVCRCMLRGGGGDPLIQRESVRMRCSWANTEEALAREREGGRQSGGQRHADQGSACHDVTVETLQPTSLGLLL